MIPRSVSISQPDFDGIIRIDQAIRGLKKVGYLAFVFITIGIPTICTAETWSALWMLGAGFTLMGVQLLISAWRYRPSRTFKELSPDTLLKPVHTLFRPLYPFIFLGGITSVLAGMAGIFERTSSLSPSRDGFVPLLLMIILGSGIAVWASAALWRSRGSRPMKITSKSIKVYLGRSGIELFEEFEWRTIERIEFVSDSAIKSTYFGPSSNGAHFRFYFTGRRSVVLPPERYGICPSTIVQLLGIRRYPQ